MKCSITVAFLFFIIILSAQETPCGLNGPGTQGTLANCEDGPENYTVPAGCCSSLPNWSWFLGSIYISNSNIGSLTFPISFTLPGPPLGPVSGEIISASSNQIVIDWFCPQNCNGGIFGVVELLYCGQEFFNPIIRINCKPVCEPKSEICFLVDCGACIGALIDGKPVIIQHTGQDPELWCFDPSSVGSWFPCNSLPSPQEDIARLTANLPLRFIPEISIAKQPRVKHHKKMKLEGVEIEVTIPSFNIETLLRITNPRNQVILQKPIKDGFNKVSLGDVPNGRYNITIQNKEYSYTTKITIRQRSKIQKIKIFKG